MNASTGTTTLTIAAAVASAVSIVTSNHLTDEQRVALGGAAPRHTRDIKQGEHSVNITVQRVGTVKKGRSHEALQINQILTREVLGFAMDCMSKQARRKFVGGILHARMNNLPIPAMSEEARMGIATLSGTTVIKRTGPTLNYTRSKIVPNPGLLDNNA